MTARERIRRGLPLAELTTAQADAMVEGCFRMWREDPDRRAVEAIINTWEILMTEGAASLVR